MNDDMVSARTFRDPILKLIGLVGDAGKYTWSQEKTPGAEFVRRVDQVALEMASLLPENQEHAGGDL